jgi:abequosyltransferase
MSSKLAIAIPTYNRADILKFNLLKIIDDLKEFDIPIYLSDDSTNNEIQTLANELKKVHPSIYYCKNEIRLGHDLNCMRTLSLPSEQYIWYMGDSMIIKKGVIKEIADIISTNDYDFISCNADGRNLEIDSKTFTNGIELLEQLAWHLTMSGATIYNRNVILNHSKLDISKCKNFPQLAIIFEEFAAKSTKLYWINKKLIFNNTHKKSYWSSKVFETFIDDFKSFLYNLPELYPINSKNDAMFKHSTITGIFNYHSFVAYRIKGFYNYSVFKKYKNDFKKYTKTNTFVLLVISLICVRALKFLYPFIKKAYIVIHK